MNENIKHYLFRYTENPDPQYAVMLKGKWGCGKTHFVNKWISEYTAQQKAGQYVISPIYVSLYGLNSTKQITKAIDKVLHPLLYSKGAEFTKKLFKIAGKVVLKTSLDWNGDAKEDASFEAALDSLSILSSKDSDIKGAKLIIFDDIERCMVDMKELLGFINAFVEHASCHVILVGDDTHLKEISKKTLAEFSEKTVGREFEILPDIDAAIDVFLHKDLPLVDWIRGQKALIVDIFRATRCNNLRILRQCLYDFSNMLGELEIELNSKFSKILSGLLASYIVLYCEYKGCNADLIKSWNTSYMSGLMGHENDKQRISDLQNKYNYITNKYQIYVFNENHIPEIVNEIERGITPTDYVQKLLEYSLQEITIQDRLADFFKLDLSDFTTLCSQLIEDLINENIANNYLYGRSLALLSFFEREKMFELPEDFVSFTKGHIKKSFDDVNDQETLYQCKKEYQMGFQSFMQMDETPIDRDIIDYLNTVFEEQEKRLPNKMMLALLNLSDDTVSELKNISDEVVPSGRCAFRMISIFKDVDSQIVGSKLLNLSNKGLVEFAQFLSTHYRFDVYFADQKNMYSDDKPFLINLRAIMQNEMTNRKSVDRYVFNYLMKYIDGAIKRAEGECNAIFV